MSAIAEVIWIIAAIGAINWGLVGFFHYNLIDRLLADRPTQVVYAIIGICGVIALVLLPRLKVKMGSDKTPAHR